MEVTTPIDQVSLTVKNFKCFGDQPQGFPAIKSLNVIIGRNNAGKSTLLDLINYAVSPAPIQERGHKGTTPTVMVEFPLTEKAFNACLPDDRQHLSRDSFSWVFVPRIWAKQRLAGMRFVWTMNEKGNLTYVGLPSFESTNTNEIQQLQWVANRLDGRVPSPFKEFQFRRIVADRDIGPEGKDASLTVAANGVGVTNVIARYLVSESLSRDLIEETLLTELNRVLFPDARYTRILVQEQANSSWEVFLEESKKGRIRLSQTGSGLKTVLLVLVNLLVVPRVLNKPLSEFFFAFEELENNLHPAVQRRLFQYLRDTAEREKCYFFLTTHSSVVIDQFSADPLAQILHVTHDGEKSMVNVVEASHHGRSVLEDLDVRASDLLQTNVVVWVEGPSDCIYFNRWIELWSNGTLQEGQHYQCLPYGGSVISHFSFDDPEWVKEMIPDLKINRHAIVLMDSDKNALSDELKPNVIRIVGEVTKIGGMPWVTDGKEVENYIPANVFGRLLANDKLHGPGQFKSALQYIAVRKGQSTEPR